MEPQQEVACLLSVGCGIYQPEKFSDFNPQKYLFAGQHWKKPWKLFHEVYELIGFMTKAVSLIIQLDILCIPVEYVQVLKNYDKVVPLSKTFIKLFIAWLP